jgi:Rhodopirellula transposase DDE domain
LTGVVEPNTGGDPMGPTKFVRRSLQAIGADLEPLGYDLCPSTIARLLRTQHFSLRVNSKRFTGPNHPDRDRQFRNIQVEIDRFWDEGLPILSVDTKKKELVGNFKNAGELWCQEPEEVNVYDFLSDAICRAVPYGLYDVLANRGHVCIGTSADTPAFAVEAIRSWWVHYGCKRYRGADELLILADGGGSNGHRPRWWKLALQEQLSDRYGLYVTVCHYPTGASKWNPVEHRLFGPISVNWAGRPLRSLEVMQGWIRGTRTEGGLEVTTSLDEQVYPKGLRVSDEEMDQLHLQRHETCPQWNYTISPRTLELLN